MVKQNKQFDLHPFLLPVLYCPFIFLLYTECHDDASALGTYSWSHSQTEMSHEHGQCCRLRLLCQCRRRKVRRIMWIDKHTSYIHISTPDTYISARHWSMQNLQARFSTFNGSMHIWGSRMSRNYCILLFWGSCYVMAVLGMVTLSLDALSNSSPHRTRKATKTCYVFGNIEDSTSHLHLTGHNHPVWLIKVTFSFSFWFHIPFLACNPKHAKKVD